MKKLLLVAMLLMASVAYGQTPVLPAVVVADCAAITALPANARSFVFINTAGTLCTNSSGGSTSVTQGTSPWIVAGGGVAGTAASGVVSVQGIASGTVLPISSTSAQTITVVQPTMTNLRVSGGDAAGTPTAGTVLAVQGITSGTKMPVSIFDSTGTAIAAVTDPCDGNAKTAFPFSISSATTTQLLATSASNKWYVCHIDIIVASANNIALVEDDTASCASPTAGMAGGTTAATGWNITGNGISFGNGSGSVFQTAATGRYVCIITSGAAQTSGNIMAVAAP